MSSTGVAKGMASAPRGDARKYEWCRTGVGSVKLQSGETERDLHFSRKLDFLAKCLGGEWNYLVTEFGQIYFFAADFSKSRRELCMSGRLSSLR